MSPERFYICDLYHFSSGNTIHRKHADNDFICYDFSQALSIHATRHAKCQQTGARFNVYVVACDESGDLVGRRQERQFKLRLTTNQLNL